MSRTTAHARARARIRGPVTTKIFMAYIRNTFSLRSTTIHIYVYKYISTIHNYINVYGVSEKSFPRKLGGSNFKSYHNRDSSLPRVSLPPPLLFILDAFVSKKKINEAIIWIEKIFDFRL